MVSRKQANTLSKSLSTPKSKIPGTGNRPQAPTNKSSIAIIGAGFTGLSAAHYLAGQGFRVNIFEADSQIGGLTQSFKSPTWSWPLEKFYHHLFSSDYYAQKSLKQLKLSKQVFFQRATTAVYLKKHILALDSPLNLLQFPYLRLSQKIRMGLGLLFLKIIPAWQILEKTTAQNWINKFMGPASYQTIWQPLLQGKFHKYSEEVNAAWFWARIKKRSSSLGYITGGFQTWIQAYQKHLKRLNTSISVNSPITRIKRVKNKLQLELIKNKKTKKQKNFHAILFTGSSSNLCQISNFEPCYQKAPTFLASQTLILSLKKPLTSIYWLNILDKNFPFLALIEHTNFINSKYYNGEHIIYLGNYLPLSHPLLRKKATQLTNIFIPYLKQINPSFSTHWINNSWSFTKAFAQPITRINQSSKIQPIHTNIPGLFFAGLESVYPWDRGTNYAVNLGQQAAKTITKYLTSI